MWKSVTYTHTHTHTHTHTKLKAARLHKQKFNVLCHENSIAKRLAACFIHILFTYVEFQGFSSVTAQNSMLLGLGYDAATQGNSIPILQWNILPPSSESRSQRWIKHVRVKCGDPINPWRTITSQKNRILISLNLLVQVVATFQGCTI